MPRVPEPAYPAKDTAVLYGDQGFYERISKAVEDEGKGGAKKEVVEEFEIPIRSGRAWVVRKGQICTLSTPKGPQVGDLNIWSLDNPRERFWASRTRQLHASHVSIGDRLWSNLPYLRPLATIVGDTLKDYGVDGVGGRVHDLLGTRCDPYVNKLLSDNSFDYHCHSNLTRAVLPHGLNESDVHDVLNVFQVTGLNIDGKYFMETCPAKPGDSFSFLAETDLLCAMSTCPGGDLSVHGWGEDSAKRMLETCRPLGVKVYEFAERDEILKGWAESKRPGYQGFHGLKIPVFGQE
ncbi:hypothetical protein PVAG01_07073 [Phlyctema vagabunda]|uniref:DUF1989 domain-containing protein n=1 Tax=Phlyctema vagabunda TaxID=108571 RepID=A0ABR4PBD6_9HELO